MRRRQSVNLESAPEIAEDHIGDLSENLGSSCFVESRLRLGHRSLALLAFKNGDFAVGLKNACQDLILDVLYRELQLPAEDQI